MSKVIEFYMSLLDEEHFLTNIQDVGGAIVALMYAATPEVVAIDAASVKNTSKQDGYASLCLINNGIKPKVIVRPAGAGRYSIDAAASDVVKFTRWTMLRNDGKQEPGRLWYDDHDNNCKPKRKEFLAWAASVLQLIKKNYYRSNEHHGRYFGPDAWAKLQDGQMVVAPY